MLVLLMVLSDHFYSLLNTSNIAYLFVLIPSLYSAQHRKRVQKNRNKKPLRNLLTSSCIIFSMGYIFYSFFHYSFFVVLLLFFSVIVNFNPACDYDGAMFGPSLSPPPPPQLLPSRSPSLPIMCRLVRHAGCRQRATNPDYCH